MAYFLFVLADPPLFWTVRVNSFLRTLLAKFLCVDVEAGSDVRSKKNMRSRYMSLIAAKLLTTWLSKVVVMLASPARCEARASSATA